jgi:hypothetical protein
LLFSDSENMHQWSHNNFQSFTLHNQLAPLSRHSKVHVLVGNIATKAIEILFAPFKECLSTECE